MEEANYIIQVSRNGTDWGISHWLMGTYTKEEADAKASRIDGYFPHIRVLKQTITLEEV